MTPSFAWMLSVIGPVALVLIPQFFAQKALAKRGVPESLGPARDYLRSTLMNACIVIASIPNNGRRVPLTHIFGDDVSSEIRLNNERCIEAYRWFQERKIMLPAIYNVQPILIIGLMVALTNLVFAPQTDGGIIQSFGGVGLWTVLIGTSICMIGCVVVAIAYLHTVDILVRLENRDDSSQAKPRTRTRRA